MSVTPGGRDVVPGAPAVTVHDVESKPPLHRAALIGSVFELEALIAQGADVDAVDSQRMTALHMAAANGHMVTSISGLASVRVSSTCDERGVQEAATELIKQGASTSARSADGYSPQGQDTLLRSNDT